MKRYNDNEKQQALDRAKEVGVKQTCEEQNISVQTLYKWINEEKGKKFYTPMGVIPPIRVASQVGAVPQNTLPAEPQRMPYMDLARVLGDDDLYEAKIKELEGENYRLRQVVSRLKKVIMELA